MQVVEMYRNQAVVKQAQVGKDGGDADDYDF